MARSRTSSAYSPRPTQWRRYLEPPETDSENDSEEVSRTNPQPDGNTSPQSTSVTIPKCIPALIPMYAKIREDVKGLVPRICRWKTKFHRQQAPPLEKVLHAVGDSTNIKSILVPTLEEQKANHMKGFVPYHDDPDANVDN
ncbi:hypothetical protein TIFTF001_007713 [Ficus carica]|uniref:Uncharacterized protein n=1 Tax=Ficus carica TaxID=3494 RepID=A0AA87ZTP2_FICCA|nr:hypothetical protein TIFTF001_007713 [Ficus carica]